MSSYWPAAPMPPLAWMIVGLGFRCGRWGAVTLSKDGNGGVTAEKICVTAKGIWFSRHLEKHHGGVTGSQLRASSSMGDLFPAIPIRNLNNLPALAALTDEIIRLEYRVRVFEP